MPRTADSDAGRGTITTMDKTHKRDEGTTWSYDDGGRKLAGFRGDAGDCVVRAIAIAAELPYLQVYGALGDGARDLKERRMRLGRRTLHKSTSPRDGVPRPVYTEYMRRLGWTWTPTMGIGTGCRVHLRASELPPGRLVVAVSKHLVAVVDGIVRDTYDCTRLGTRCVYGYWTRTQG